MLSRKQKMGTASTDNWLSRLRGGDRAMTERQVETKEECFHVLVCVYAFVCGLLFNGRNSEPLFSISKKTWCCLHAKMQSVSWTESIQVKNLLWIQMAGGPYFTHRCLML